MCILYRFFKQTNDIEVLVPFQLCRRCHHGHDRMVVGFTTTYAIGAYTTDIVSSILDQDEVYNNVIKFISDLRQVGSFSGSSGFLHL